jgi:hypothetical protein
VNDLQINSAQDIIKIISSHPGKELNITYIPYCETCENDVIEEKTLILTPSNEGKI